MGLARFFSGGLLLFVVMLVGMPACVLLAYLFHLVFELPFMTSVQLKKSTARPAVAQESRDEPATVITPK